MTGAFLRRARARVQARGRVGALRQAVRAGLGLLALLAVSGWLTAARAETVAPPPLVSLTILGEAGAAHAFRVEIVATPETRARGLMFRKKLARDEGMLFVYPEPAPASFWMRNTLIPLDIIFADARGEILNIIEARPLDETPLPSAGPTQFVLEIRGGLAAELGVGPGDRIVSPAMLAAAARAR